MFTWKDLARPKPCPYGSVLYKRVINSSQWVAQEKVDGWRVLVTTSRGGTVSITTRHGEGLTCTTSFARTVALAVPAMSTLDCELLRPWKKLVALDVLQIAGRDMSRQPLSERMMRLQSLLDGASSGMLCLVRGSATEKEELYKTIVDSGGEGVVLKRLLDPYPRAGVVWLKVKPGMGA